MRMERRGFVKKKEENSEQLRHLEDGRKVRVRKPDDRKGEKPRRRSPGNGGRQKCVRQRNRNRGKRAMNLAPRKSENRQAKEIPHAYLGEI